MGSSMNSLKENYLDWISKTFSRCMFAMGIEDAIFHDLRRTFGYDLIRQGMPIYQVSKLLGHRSVVTTERHYAPLLATEVDDFMLVSTIPILLLLNEKPKDFISPGILNITLSAFKQIFATIKSASKHKPAVIVLITKFFYSCSLNGALMFIVLYGTETAGFDAKYVETVYALALLIAIPFAIIWGKLIDSIGVVITTKINLVIMVFLLAIGAVIPELDLTNKEIYWALLGMGAGIVTPGLWVSDRPLLVLVSPQNQIGEFFGFHGLVGRLSAILASFSWGFIVTTLGFGQQIAVIFLSLCSVFALVSIMFLNKK